MIARPRPRLGRSPSPGSASLAHWRRSPDRRRRSSRPSPRSSARSPGSSSCCGCVASTLRVGETTPSREDRRRFVVGVTAAGVLALTAGGLGLLLDRARAARTGQVVLPEPMDPAPPLPAGAALDVGGPVAVHHAERRLLPGRHRADRARGRRRHLDPADPRHGRARGDPHPARAPRAADRSSETSPCRASRTRSVDRTSATRAGWGSRWRPSSSWPACGQARTRSCRAPSTG